LKEMTPFEKNDGLNDENAIEFENYLQEHLENEKQRITEEVKIEEDPQIVDIEEIQLMSSDDSQPHLIDSDSSLEISKPIFKSEKKKKNKKKSHDSMISEL